jgi:hypothetical protein
MDYLLWRLVCNGIPVLYRIKSGVPKYILFDQRQAFLVLTGSVESSVLLVNWKMWVLVDANTSPDSIPSELLIFGLKSMFVYSTSPRRSRWQTANQFNLDLVTVIMNPWSKWEAELL